MNTPTNEPKIGAGWHPTNVRNQPHTLLHRVADCPVDICTYRESVQRSGETIMMYYLDHLNYPAYESGVYPTQHPHDLGYHVLSNDITSPTTGRTLHRYKVVLLYLDESGDLRYHVCNHDRMTTSAVLKYLHFLQHGPHSDAH